MQLNLFLFLKYFFKEGLVIMVVSFFLYNYED